MSDFREPIPDDERDVPLEEDDELTAAPTIDPEEAVEVDVDEQDDEEREAAIEAGQLDTSG